MIWCGLRIRTWHKPRMDAGLRNRWRRLLETDRKRGKLVYWAGAGISVDGPSCMPTGYQLSNAVLEALCRTNPKIFEMVFRGTTSPKAFINPLRIAAIHTGVEITESGLQRDGLRLETVMEAAHAQFGAVALDCLAFMAGIKPNSFHRYLAHEIVDGARICTVNFDLGIEAASSAPPTTFLPSEEAPYRPQIIKAHGDISRVDSLAVTLSSFRSGLRPVLARALDEMLEDSHVVFVGYSASDHFDLTPFLMGKKFSRITWCDYRPFGDLLVKRCGADELAPDRLSPVVHGLMSRSEEAWLVSGNIASAFGIKASASRGRQAEWRRHIRRWGSSLDPHKAAMAVSGLAQSIGLWRLADRILSVALQDNPGNLDFEVNVRRDYLQSVAGKYATRERRLQRFACQLELHKDEPVARFRLLKLRRLIAECKAFDDRFTAAISTLAVAWMGLWRLQLQLSSDGEPSPDDVEAERVLCRNDLLFILRIPVWRSLFQWIGPAVAVLVQLISLLILRLPGRRPQLVDQVRARRYRGEEPLQDILGTARSYWELENLLGLSNVLRERAAREIIKHRPGGKIDLQEVRKFIRQSYQVSKLIEDRPGMAKALVIMTWVEFKRGDAPAVANLARRAHAAIDEIEAPNWGAKRHSAVSHWRAVAVRSHRAWRRRER